LSLTRALGHAPLRTRRRRERERGPNALLLAGCDPAERYPALQALLPGAAAHVQADGTVMVAGVGYADEREGLLPSFAGAAVWLVGSRQVAGRAWVHLADELAHDPDVVADPVTAERLAGDAGGAGAGAGEADTTPRPHSGTGDRADPCTSTLWGWGTAATGRSDPVCTVVTAELAQRVGWRWPPSAAFDHRLPSTSGQRRQRKRA
jgi:hypothetical protein